MTVHPDVACFPVCPFDNNEGRIRPCGDRFCRDPDNPKQLVVLADCLACRWPTSTTPPPPRRPKVGDVLARMLAADYGASVTSGCDCAGRIAQMNEWGPDGCEGERDTIAGWLIEAASKEDALFRDHPELDLQRKRRRLRSIVPDFGKRWFLRGYIRKAIREVREWAPPQETAAAAAE